MKNKFGELFSIKQPFDIKTTEDTSAESFTQKILVVMRNNIDNAIVGEIVKTATAEGVTDLAILNKAEIIKALEKQIPRKIIKETEETGFGDMTYFHCSCCGFLQMSRLNGQLFSGDRYKYCRNCGQAVDWSERE